MAALNFPDPAVTQEFEAAGILWTWNATLGVWSSETTTAFDAGELYLSKRNDDAADGNIEFKGLTKHQQGVQLPNLTNTAALATDVDGNIIAGTGGGGSAEFLSKVNDDTAAGQITFEGATTHEAGVIVTGGDNTTIEKGIGIQSTSDRLAVINDNNPVLTIGKNQQAYALAANSDIQLNQSGTNPALFSLDYKGTGHDSTSIYSGFLSTVSVDVGSNISHFNAKHQGSTVQTADNIKVIGFRSNVSPNSTTGTNSQSYNFYAEGNAPNFFQGPIEAVGTVNATFGSAVAPAYSFLTKENAGMYFADTNRVHIATSGVRRASFGSGLFECPGIYNNTDSSGSDVVVDTAGRLRRKGSSRAYKTNIEPIEYSYAENILNNAQPVYYKPKVQDPEYPQAYLDMIDAQIAAGNTDISPSVYQCEEFCDENNIPWTMDEKWMNEGSDPNLSYWGFIAEDLAEVDPRLAAFNPHLDRYDGVRYAEFAPVLLKICQRQRDQIADLEVRLAALERA
jgi:hypothetical protein